MLLLYINYSNYSNFWYLYSKKAICIKFYYKREYFSQVLITHTTKTNYAIMSAKTSEQKNTIKYPQMHLYTHNKRFNYLCKAKIASERKYFS